MKQHLMENSFLYSFVEFSRKKIIPLRNMINISQFMLSHPMNIYKDTSQARFIEAGLEVMNRLLKEYKKPEFGIKSVSIDGEEIKITEEVISSRDFCKLLHFKKVNYTKKLPKLLLVAPLSGHHATLLRGTVKDTLPFFDVYITDWTDASQVPLAAGKFDLDDFVHYTIDFIKMLGKKISVMAVCQPVVPVLAAVSLMEEDGADNVSNMILIGGPVDARESSTQVTEFANNHSMYWFESNVITRVPINYPGFMRAVYPGFLQLLGFMSMNAHRHFGEHVKLFNHLVIGDGESVEYHRKFYDEYLSVMDMTAEFYLQTIKTVFKDFSLPKGEMMVNGRRVKPEAIKKSSILIIEGELDDISGIGQTKAALKICKNADKAKTHYHLQPGVGHYGVFNGSKFRGQILPVIHEFCLKHI